MSRMSMAVWNRRIRRMATTMPDVVRNAYTRAAIIVIGHAQKHHLSGPKMPRGVSGGFSGSTLAVQSTELRNRLAHKLGTTTLGRVIIRVGTNVTSGGYSYPRAHEYGLGKMPERPFLRPSVDAKRNNTVKEIRNGVIQAYARK